MNEKFTPGPWEYIYPVPLSEGMRIFSSNKYIGFVGNTDMSVDEMNANAQLIAAAPDMYEALLKCVSADPTIAMNRPGWMDYIASIEGARAALKKARGEQ